jgi:hypothetical protein
MEAGILRTLNNNDGNKGKCTLDYEGLSVDFVSQKVESNEFDD